MARQIGGGERPSEPRDRRPLFGLIAAALAVAIVPAVNLINPPPPNVISEGPQPFVAVAQAVDAYWKADFKRQFPNASDAYRTPKVIFAEDNKRFSRLLGEYAGYYTEGNESMRIVIDEPAYFVFFVIAHEFGHHVQALSGLADERSRRLRLSGSREAHRQINLRYELQAECFAGVWASYAAREGRVLSRRQVSAWRQAMRFSKDSPTHGTAVQQLKWFDAGYTTGSAQACDTFAPAWNAL